LKSLNALLARYAPGDQVPQLIGPFCAKKPVCGAVGTPILRPGVALDNVA